MGDTPLVKGLQAQVAESNVEIKRLEKLVYVPGVTKCAKCKFSQISSTFNVGSGKLSANNSPQQCPNGCGPLWRVTERDAGNEMADRCEAMQAQLEDEREVSKSAMHDLQLLSKECGDLHKQLEAEKQHSAKLLAGYPDGMTPSDVEHLYRANAGLADEIRELQRQLEAMRAQSEELAVCLENVMSRWHATSPGDKGCEEGCREALARLRQKGEAECGT